MTWHDHITDTAPTNHTSSPCFPTSLRQFRKTNPATDFGPPSEPIDQVPRHARAELNQVVYLLRSLLKTLFELMQRRCARVFAVLVGAGQLTCCLAEADANHCSSLIGRLSADSCLIQVNSRAVKIQVPDMSAVYNNQLKDQPGSVSGNLLLNLVELVSAHVVCCSVFREAFAQCN